MPGPGTKGKASKKNKKGATPSVTPSAISKSTPAQCQTLEEDEMTYCGQPVTYDGRCAVHAKQYRTMYKKYKEASKTVDEIKQNKTIPTKEQVERLTKDRVAQMITWLRQYLESIRVERTGRDIHSKRFFLKSDDGHKIRLKVLAREMAKAAETLDCLYTRAVELELEATGTEVPKWVKDGSSEEEDHTSSGIPFTAPEFAQTSVETRTQLPSSDSGESAEEDADLIEIRFIAEKAKMLRAIQLVWDPDLQNSIMLKNIAELYKDVNDDQNSMIQDSQKVYHLMTIQFARRIIFHHPLLHYKSLGKVSFQDLVLSKDFDAEDMGKFLELFIGDRLGFRLGWLKDALVEALVMSRTSSGSANVGNIKNRISILGGWIFNSTHTQKISNEAWWYLIHFNGFPANVENRLVRLCHSFDDIIGFLSFAALDMIPPPSFCRFKDPVQDAACLAARKNLSLSGVILTDMITCHFIEEMSSPIPNMRMKAKKRGCIVWSEMEARSHVFGALRNEPDAFTEAFLRELRSRPDLFQVVTRSETDPPLKVDSFGNGPNAALPCRQSRSFEAPATDGRTSTAKRGPWTVHISAVDRLYGTGEPPGFLTIINRGMSKNNKTTFFRFLNFPVKYFVILDTVPHRPVSVLAQNVAWAALRAGGYAEGEFETNKYYRASGKLFAKCAKERLSWMPESWSE